MTVPAEHRRWIVVNAVVITAVLNLVINAVLVWNQTRDGRHVVLWSMSATHPSIGTDTLGTFVVLPIITTLLCTTAVRRELAGQRISPLTPTHLGRWSRLAAPGLLRRAARLGALSLTVFTVPAVIVLELTARGGMGAHDFAIYHVALCIGLGAVVTPLVALIAMTDGRPALATSATA